MVVLDTWDHKRIELAFQYFFNLKGFSSDDGRGGQIRTVDPTLPKRVLYQAELHPDSSRLLYRWGVAKLRYTLLLRTANNIVYICDIIGI